ncbi:MAG: TIGR03621 family F420-dependent LLM class oxidoreductase [Acidimicrobiales bacterium]|nr:TIGR03621 family F420-dependent LLM class oxidoreductase [Acidimicrobiales bacterium]
MNTIRVGLQLIGDQVLDPVPAARAAEDAGFDVVLVADHIGATRHAPLVNLTAIAAATERIRLGTYVLNNDMRHPVQLAWEAATLDRLSGGRFELGLGAGHTPHEYAEVGIALDPPGMRKARLREAVEIIRPLLDGETVDFEGAHYRIEAASVIPAMQERLPILVGSQGAAMLRHAGEHADGIGLMGLGRTLPDGHRHTVSWATDRLDQQVAHVREGAVGHDRRLDLSALVQVCEVTDDRAAALAAVIDDEIGLTAEVADTAPYVAVGTVDEIAAHFRVGRDRWGITTYVVRCPDQTAIDAFAPVIAALR